MTDKVVVTGGSGRLGQYVLSELSTDYSVTNVDLVPGEIGVDLVRCDITDFEAVRAAVGGARAVCHLAALDYDTHALPHEYMRVNALGSWNVMQAAAETGVKRVVLTSSVSAFGLFEDGAERALPRYLPVDEAHPCQPVAPYGISKLLAELAAERLAASYDIDVVCLRPLAVALRGSAARARDWVAGRPEGWLHNYVAATDVARAFRCAIEVEIDGFALFNIGAADTGVSEPTLQWYADQVGPPPTIREPGLYSDHPRAAVFSSAAARAGLGWEPRVSLDDIGSIEPA